MISGLNRDRVAEIFTSLPGSSDGSFGSGYLVSVDLLLTARHVVVPKGEERQDLPIYQARTLDQSDWSEAKLIYENENLDIALLRIKSPSISQSKKQTIEPVKWGRLSGLSRIPCEAIGFPMAQKRGKLRDTEKIEGYIDLGSAAKRGRVTVHISGSVPSSYKSTQSLWQGMSGAALFSGPYLVGVIIVDPDNFDSNRLEAVAVPGFVGHDHFVEQLTGRRDAVLTLHSVSGGKGIYYTNEPDPYEYYLHHLLDRINSYISQKIITGNEIQSTLDPIRLSSTAIKDFVDQALEKELIDPLFLVGGIHIDSSETKFDALEEACRTFHHRILLLGEPGSGKTITLLQFARDAIQRRLENSSQPLPVFAVIASWSPQRYKDSVDLKDWLIASYGTPNNVGDLFGAGNLLLMLDGLDELGSEYRDSRTGETFDPRAKFLSLIPENNQVIVTSRTHDYRAVGEKIKLHGAVILQPLKKPQILEYVANQPELLQAINSDNTLADIATNPLVLSLLAFAYRGLNVSERRSLHRINEGPRELRRRVFKFYVEQRYEHEKRKRIREEQQPIQFSLQDIIDLLGELTMKGLETVSSGFSHEYYYDDFLRFIPEDKAFDLIRLSIQLHILNPTINSERIRIEYTENTDAQSLILIDEWVDDFKRSSQRDIYTVFDIQRGRGYALQFAHTIIHEYFSSEFVHNCLRNNQSNYGRIHLGLALERLKDDEAIEVLIGCLDKDSPFIPVVSYSEASAISGWEVFQAMAGHFSLDPRVWEIASKALARFGDAALVPLVKTLETSVNTTIICRVMTTLSKIRKKEVVKDIIKYIDHNDVNIRYYAVITIGSILESDIGLLRAHANKNVLEFAQLEQDAPGTAKAVEEAVSRLNQSGKTELQYLENSDIIKLLFDTLANDISAEVRIETANTIHKITDEMSGFERLIELYIKGDRISQIALLNLFSQDNPSKSELRTSSYVSNKLAEINDSEIVSLLLRNFPSNSTLIIKSLRFFGWEQNAFRFLISLLANESDEIRYFAAESLGFTGSIDAVHPLITLLNDPVISVQACAAWSLGLIRSPIAVIPLIRKLKKLDKQDSNSREHHY